MNLKRIMAFSMLLLMALPLFFSVHFIIRQQLARAEMKQRLKTSLLQSVTVNANEVKWIKPGKEILVKGHFFDVKNARQAGDKIIFTGLFDEDERTLHQSLNDFIQQKKKQQQPVSLLLDKFFSTAVTVSGQVTAPVSCWKIIPIQFPRFTPAVPVPHRIPFFIPPRV